MIILAVDSSTKAGSAAVVRDGVVCSESYADVGLTHSQTLMQLVDEALRRAQIAPKDVDLFAATAGPGSFTGLRIGIGTVKGLAFPTDTPCAAVSTLEALAFGAAPCERLVVPVLDARRNRFYCAAFRCEDGVQRVWEDGVLDADALLQKLQGERVLFTGDGAEMCYTMFKDKLDCVLANPANRLPRASFAALAAAQRGETVSVAAMAPIYLQLSQAERERNKKQGE